MTQGRKEPMLFRKKILAGTTDTLHERVKGEGIVEELRIRFYPGQENSFEVTPIVEHKGNKVEHMVTFPNTSKQFISGDDDNFVFPISVAVENDDFIKVKVKNTSSYDYDLVCDVIVNYF